MPESTSGPALTRTRFELRPRDGGPPVRGDLHVVEGTEPLSAVVICHGFKGFREWGFFPAVARAVAARGHAAVSFDFSRNGVGADGVAFSALDRFAEQTHSRDVDEIRMVLDAIRGGELMPKRPRRMGLLGHSRGGGEAVLAAAEDGGIDALVTWNAIATVHRWTEEQLARWRHGGTVEITNARTGEAMPIGPGFLRDLEENTERLDIRRAAGRLELPWLIVHGEADTSVPPDDARALWDMAGDNAELLLIEDADHTFGAKHPYAGATDALRAATDATLDWFGTHLE
jgi:fermentation-respiration switch protein FrsA (DUF1100 family)